MIVLDATIVNVALPSIKDDLGFSQSNLAWVVNAYLIAFGGLLLLCGAHRRPDRPASHLPARARRLHRRVAALRHGADPGHADRRALRPGRRRRDRVGGDPRDDRDDVPRAARAGEGDRRLQLRRLGRRLDRAAGRRRAHRGDQLALDLLHQRADRHRDRAARGEAGRGPPRHRPQGGRRRPGRGAAHRRADARRLHAAGGRRAGMGVDPDARARRRRDRAARGVRRAPGAHREPADAAAPVPLAERHGGKRRHGAAGGRVLRDVLPRRPLPAGDPRLQPPRRSGWPSCPPAS